jgi:6,7-dimethyl-8-ribityllumazine synthase
MTDIRQTSGHLDGRGLSFGIVASRFNGRLVEPLIAGAVDALVRHGVDPGSIHLARVPGAWEIPQALEELAATGEHHGLIPLGVVVRGETPHFDYICAACSQGCAAVAARHRLPVAFGVLTCDSSEQAAERAGGKAGNKGWDAAVAALEMATLFAGLRAGSSERT